MAVCLRPKKSLWRILTLGFYASTSFRWWVFDIMIKKVSPESDTCKHTLVFTGSERHFEFLFIMNQTLDRFVNCLWDIKFWVLFIWVQIPKTVQASVICEIWMYVVFLFSPMSDDFLSLVLNSWCPFRPLCIDLLNHCDFTWLFFQTDRAWLRGLLIYIFRVLPRYSFSFFLLAWW